MASQQEDGENLKKITDIMKAIDFGMLTTVDTDGKLHSRPMSNNKEVEFDGDLWFFTSIKSHKIEEIEKQPEVNVSFSNPDGQAYVSLSGRAELIRDRQKIKELWNPSVEAWFPEGADDPHIALLKIHAEQGEYWEGHSSRIAQVFSLAKSLATGQRPSMGAHDKVDIA